MSNPSHVPVVMHYLMHLSPTSIFDVGAGIGTYGFLARQYLDIGYERLAPSEWKVKIDGVEIFGPYENPIWAYFYDNVDVIDIRLKLGSVGNYDIILCNDVLEHFSHAEALNIFHLLLASSRVVIVTTPNRDFPQGAWGGNEAETHRCLLSPEDFPIGTQAHRAGVTTCYVASKSEQTTTQIRTIASSAPIISYRVPSFYSRAKRALMRELKARASIHK